MERTRCVAQRQDGNDGERRAGRDKVSRGREAAGRPLARAAANVKHLNGAVGRDDIARRGDGDEERLIAGQHRELLAVELYGAKV